MKPIILPVLAVTLVETGAAMVMLNAAPHQPLGFWLWFGGLATLAPIQGVWLYRHLAAKV